jgi:hypothetical protein
MVGTEWKLDLEQKTVGPPGIKNRLVKVSVSGKWTAYVGVYAVSTDGHFHAPTIIWSGPDNWDGMIASFQVGSYSDLGVGGPTWPLKPVVCDCDGNKETGMVFNVGDTGCSLKSGYGTLSWSAFQGLVLLSPGIVGRHVTIKIKYIDHHGIQQTWQSFQGGYPIGYTVFISGELRKFADQWFCTAADFNSPQVILTVGNAPTATCADNYTCGAGICTWYATTGYYNGLHQWSLCGGGWQWRWTEGAFGETGSGTAAGWTITSWSDVSCRNSGPDCGLPC